MKMVINCSKKNVHANKLLHYLIDTPKTVVELRNLLSCLCDLASQDIS